MDDDGKPDERDCDIIAVLIVPTIVLLTWVVGQIVYKV